MSAEKLRGGEVEKLSGKSVPSSQPLNPSTPQPTWFFSDPVAVTRLLASCESLRGTPFRFGSKVKGKTGGTDCVGACEIVMVESGAVQEFNFPRRPEDMSRHVHNDRILNYLRGLDPDPQSAVLAARFEELVLPQISQKDTDSKKKKSAGIDGFLKSADELFPFMVGDLLILKTGRGLWHIAIMLNSHAFMQCAFPDGVTEGDITAPNYREHLVAAFRARARLHTEDTKATDG